MDKQISNPFNLFYHLVSLYVKNNDDRYQTMMLAHQNGMASVGKWCFEIAELYNEGLRKNGIISDIVPVGEDQ